MIELLLRRIVDARAVGRLRGHLADLKTQRSLPRSSFRISGNTETICSSVIKAVSEGVLSLKDIAVLVDEIEENGFQHIFLFEVASQAEMKALQSAVQEAYPASPQEPTNAYYAELPTTNRLTHELRDGSLVAKFVGKTSYWVIDDEDSHEDENTQVIVKKKKVARVVHTLRLNEDQKTVEVRIQHASVDAPPSQWRRDLEQFLDRLKPAVDIGNLKAIPIWDGFQKQVDNRPETYMTVDEAHDTLTKQRMSLRRERGQDIRENDDYNLDEHRFFRETLRIYWLLNDQDGDEVVVHTIQQRIELAGELVGKVWVSRNLSAYALNHVLEKIRTYAQ